MSACIRQPPPPPINRFTNAPDPPPPLCGLRGSSAVWAAVRPDNQCGTQSSQSGKVTLAVGHRLWREPRPNPTQPNPTQPNRRAASAVSVFLRLQTAQPKGGEGGGESQRAGHAATLGECRGLGCASSGPEREVRPRGWQHRCCLPKGCSSARLSGRAPFNNSTPLGGGGGL